MSKNRIYIDLKDLSILVVDDMKSMRLTLRKMLQNLNVGKKLRFAENGKEGLEILRSTQFDLVFIDWNMPVMSGRETLYNLRELNKKVKILVLIKFEKKDSVMEAVDMGATNYMLKPFRVNDLQDKIKEVIENAV